MRVSQDLSCVLTEHDDGHQVNIPELIKSFVASCFRIGVHSKGCSDKKSVEGNPQTQMNF